MNPASVRNIMMAASVSGDTVTQSCAVPALCIGPTLRAMGLGAIRSVRVSYALTDI